MKRNGHLGHHRIKRAIVLATTGVAGLAAFQGRVSAGTYYFYGSTDLSSTSNWFASSTYVASQTPAGVVPSTSDLAVLGEGPGATGYGGGTVYLNASQSYFGLQFGGSQYTGGLGGTTIDSDASHTTATSIGANTLTIGAGGISNAAFAAGLTFNSNILLTASQTWNNIDQAATINGTVTGAQALSFAGSASWTLAGNVNVTTLNVNSGGTLLMQNASSSYAYNNLNITGTLNGISSSIVPTSGVITLNNGGKLSTTGAVSSSLSIAVAGTAGSSVLANATSTSTATYSGAITQANSNTLLDDSSSGTIALTGSTTNTGLYLWARGNHWTILGKTSSPSVHAVDLLQISDGTVQLAGTGDYQVNQAGTINFSFTNGRLDLNGHNLIVNGLIGGATSEYITNNAGGTTSTVTLGGNNGTGYSFASAIQNGASGTGVVNLVKNGSGTQSLTATSSYTGTTTINGGTLVADLSTQTASAANILPATTGLTLGGGTLAVKGSASASFTGAQTVASTTLNAGGSAVVVNSNGGGGTSVTLNGITRNTGATVDFTLPATGTISTSTANANISGGTQTILGGYATVGGSSWAVSGSGATAGNISALASGNYNTGFASGTDVEAGNATSSPASMTINSLRFNTAGAGSVNLGGALTVATGGVLETSNIGANGVNISGSTITSGNGQDLVLIQNNTNSAGAMTVGSVITGGIGLTKSGAGALSLTGVNNYTGATQINAGSVSVTNTGSLPSNTAVSLGGGTLSFTNTAAVALPTSSSAYASSSNWHNQPVNINGATPGTLYQVGANGGAAAEPDFVLIDLGANFNLNKITFNMPGDSTNADSIQVYIANSSAGSLSSLYTAGTQGSADGPETGTPNKLLGTGGIPGSAFTVDSAYLANGVGTTNAINYPLTLNGVSGEYLLIYSDTRHNGIGGGTNWYGLNFTSVSLTQSVGAITQTIGSLASASSSSTVFLDNLVTLQAGGNNTSTTFAGSLTGTGALTKAGSGVMTLTGKSTFTGATNVTAGTLAIDTTNSSTASLASTSSVTVGSSATLHLTSQLASPNLINDAAYVVLNGSGVLVQLDLSGATETVLGLMINGVAQPAGIYSSTATGATAGDDSYFGGNGSLAVTTLAPEPTSLGILALGGLLMRRRPPRRRQNSQA